jgi:DNA-binding CsgD family transcriptional regulator
MSWVDGRRGPVPRIPSSLGRLLQSSATPVAVTELASGIILFANEAAGQVLGVPPVMLVGSPLAELVVPGQRPDARTACRALADGAVGGFRGVTTMQATETGSRKLLVWASSVDVEGGRVGLYWLIPLHGPGVAPAVTSSGPSMPHSAYVVLSVAEDEWRIDGVTVDLLELLEAESADLIGTAFLSILHPADAAEWPLAVDAASKGLPAIRAIRLRTGSQRWLSVATVVTALVEDDPRALGLAVSLASDAASLPLAAGVLLSGAPAEAVAHLTPREGQIVRRILQAERVPSIADDLFLSQTTVRNHLSSIFAKMGVHSQVELIRFLRTEGGTRVSPSES